MCNAEQKWVHGSIHLSVHNCCRRLQAADNALYAYLWVNLEWLHDGIQCRSKSSDTRHEISQTLKKGGGETREHKLQRSPAFLRFVANLVSAPKSLLYEGNTPLTQSLSMCLAAPQHAVASSRVLP